MTLLKKVFLGVFWGARREDVDDCAVRLSKHFDNLSQSSPDMAVWFKKSSRKSNAKELDLSSREKLNSLLKAGINKRDFSGEEIPELGHSISVWNGGVGGSICATRVTCGMHINNPNLSNVANLEINFKEAVDFDWEGCFSRLIDIWVPDNGKVSLVYGDGQIVNSRYERHLPKLRPGANAKPQFGGFMIVD